MMILRLLFKLNFVLMPLILGIGAVMQQQIPLILAVNPSAGPPGTTVTLIDVNGTMTGLFCYAQIDGRDMRIGSMEQGTLTYTVPPDLAPETQITFFCINTADGRQSNPAMFIVTPEQIPPTDPPSPPVEPPLPEIILPQLPTSGQCVVATREAFGVNVRQGPSLDAPIVGQLDPTQIYEAAGEDGHGEWIDLVSYNPGWVSTSVIRIGGDCSTLPQTDGLSGDHELGHVVQQSAQSALLLPAVQQVRDAAARMENCPEYMPSLDILPMYLTLYIVGEPDPCAAAAATMDDLFFGSPPVSLQEMEQCPEDQPGWDVYWSLRSRTTGATQDYLISLRDTMPTFCLLLWDLSGGVINETTFPADEHVLPVALAYCDNITGYNNHGFIRGAIESRVEALNMPVSALRNLKQNCQLFEDLKPLGSVNTSNVEFFNMLVGDCGVMSGDASRRAFSDAIRGALDAGAAANQGCAGMQLLHNYPLPPDLQPALPQITDDDATCTGRFRILATHNSNLGLRTLYRILKSADPCEAANAYAYEGTIPHQVLSPPECIQDEQLILQGASQFNQVVIDASSPWWMKISALDRPLDEICMPLSQADSGGFAILPTPTLPAFAAEATPTPPIIGALPTPTMGVFVLPPTATPEMGEAAEPEPDEPTPLPPEDEAAPPPPDEPDAGQPSDDVVIQAPMDLQPDTPCFGCIPPEPVVPGGRVQALIMANNPDGSFAGLWAAPMLITPSVPAAGDPQGLQPELVELPLTGLPMSLLGYPVVVSPDGSIIGYFSHGDDPAAHAPTVRRVMIVLTDGTSGDEDSTPPSEQISFNYAKISPDVTDDLLALTQSLVLPPGMHPAPYAPVWDNDGGLILTMIGADGVESLYYIVVDENSDTAAGHLLVTNAAAPALAPNGRYLAFERVDGTGRNIYALALNNLLENPLTQQSSGAECFGPSFGPNSLTVYFTCQAGDEHQMYAYGLNGVSPISTSIPNARNPRSSGIERFIYFDDGQIVYLSTDDGSKADPYFRIELEDVLISSYHIP